ERQVVLVIERGELRGELLVGHFPRAAEFLVVLAHRAPAVIEGARGQALRPHGVVDEHAGIRRVQRCALAQQVLVVRIAGDQAVDHQQVGGRGGLDRRRVVVVQHGARQAFGGAGNEAGTTARREDGTSDRKPAKSCSHQFLSPFSAAYCSSRRSCCRWLRSTAWRAASRVLFSSVRYWRRASPYRAALVNCSAAWKRAVCAQGSAAFGSASVAEC